MADNSGGGAGMGVVVGALIVVVAAIAFFVFEGGNLGGSRRVDINVHAPSAPSAPATPSGGGQ